MRYRNVGTVSYMTTLVLGKLASLPEAVYQYLVHILSPVNDNLAFLESVPDMRVDLGTTCIQSRQTTDRDTFAYHVLFFAYL